MITETAQNQHHTRCFIVAEIRWITRHFDYNIYSGEAWIFQRGDYKARMGGGAAVPQKRIFKFCLNLSVY
jgi:hypothetical protein